MGRLAVTKRRGAASPELPSGERLTTGCPTSPPQVPASGVEPADGMHRTSCRGQVRRSSIAATVLVNDSSSHCNLGRRNSPVEPPLAPSLAGLRLVVPWINKLRRTSQETSSRRGSTMPPMLRASSGGRSGLARSPSAGKVGRAFSGYSPSGKGGSAREIARDIELNVEPAEPLISPRLGAEEEEPDDMLVSAADHSVDEVKPMVALECGRSGSCHT